MFDMGNKTILDKTAFANSLAILMVLFYLVFYLLSLIAPSIFTFLFNAQFLGANVAPLLPKISFANFIGTLVVLVASSWVMVYVWAGLYNWMAK